MSRHGIMVGARLSTAKQARPMKKSLKQRIREWLYDEEDSMLVSNDEQNIHLTRSN